MWVSILIMAMVLLAPTALYLHRWSGVTDDMTSLNAALGLPPPDLWEDSPYTYYRRHFSARLKPGMARHVVERDVLIAADEIRPSGSRDDGAAIHRYRIGTNGFVHGHDLFVYIRYSGGVIDSVVFDNS